MKVSFLILYSRLIFLLCSTTNMHEVSTFEEITVDCKGQEEDGEKDDDDIWGPYR